MGQQVNDQGRCALHPGIQLHHLKKNGEWRVLLHACPLCVSGLPPTGTPVSTPARRAAESTRERVEGERRGERGEGGGESRVVGGSGESGGGPITDEIDRRVQEKARQKKLEKKKKKSKSRGENGGGDGGSSRSHRRSSATPPGARPRSPSPEAIAMAAEPQDSGMGEIEGGGGGDYNDFLNFLQADRRQQELREFEEEQQQQQQQQQQQVPRSGGLREQIQMLQQAIDQSEHTLDMSERTDRSEYSAADTADELSAEEAEKEEEGMHKNGHYEDADGGDEEWDNNANYEEGEEEVEEAGDDQVWGNSGYCAQEDGEDNDDHDVSNEHATGRAAWKPPPPPPRPMDATSGWRTTNLSQLGRHGSNTPTSPPRTEPPRRPDPEEESQDGGSTHLPPLRYQARSPPPSQQTRGGYPPQQLHQTQQPQCNDQPDQPRVLEQDEVSMMSMSSVTRNALKQRKVREREAMDHDEESESSSSDEDGDEGEAGEDVKSYKSGNSRSRATSGGRSSGGRSHDSSRGPGGEINTADFDDRGRCRRHPTVRLRKKQLLRGWKVVLSNCPECCLDEMRRVKDERMKERKMKGDSSSSGRRHRGGGSRGSRDGKSSRKSDRRKGKRREKKPPISQLNMKDRDSDDRSIGTASTITISSYTHSTGTGRTWKNYASGARGGPGGVPSMGSPDATAAAATGGPRETARVTRMPYTDAHGMAGWYTGQVDAETGTPHGTGTMNYADGATYDGEWRDGVSAAPSRTREEPMSLPGGGMGGIGGISPRRTPGSSRRHHSMNAHKRRAPPPGAGRSYLATLNEDGSSSDYEFAASGRRSRGSNQSRSHSSSPPPQQRRGGQAQRKVVCGMMWTDAHGDRGAYTGEINALNLPDGMGSMRYEDGMVVEGLWRDGEAAGDDRGGDVEEEVQDSASIAAGSLEYGLASLGGARGGFRHGSGAASVQ